MGQASREKFEAWIAKLKAEVVREIRSVADSELQKLREAQESNKSSILGWLRGVGGTSVLIGMLGLMQSFYGVSITLFYAGLILLTVDLWAQNFRPHSRIKKTIISVVPLAAAIVFTTSVTLRKGPIEAAYAFNDERLELAVINSSPDDYQNLDFRIWVDESHDYVENPQQMSDLPSVSFMETWPGVLTGPREKAVFTADFSDPLHPKGKLARNFLRVHCDKLSSKNSLKISMDVWRVNEHGEPHRATSASRVTIDGTFAGRFKTYDFDQPAAWVPAPFSR